MAEKKADTSTATKAMTKSAVLLELATATGLKKQDISEVLLKLTELIQKQLSKKGPGVFTIPGLFKLKKDIKPPVKAHKGIDPFTKEERMFKAKPARTRIKARALKALTDSVK